MHLTYFRVGHCKVAVISDSRSKQLLKQVIMVSSYAPAQMKICRCQSSGYHGGICIKKKKHSQKVGKLQIYISLYNRIASMLFNIQYDTSDYLWSILNCMQLQGMSLIPYESDALTIYYCKVMTPKIQYQKNLRLWENQW